MARAGFRAIAVSWIESIEKRSPYIHPFTYVSLAILKYQLENIEYYDADLYWYIPRMTP
jgi:hypothetical protein